MNTTAKVLSGLLAGAAIGTITGILIAPDKGKNTLKKIKEESKQLGDDISSSISNSLNSLARTAKDRDKGKEEREFDSGKLEGTKTRV